MRQDHVKPFGSGIFQCIGKKLRLSYPQRFQQIADILVVGADPLAALKNLRDVRYVIADGKLVVDGAAR